MALDPRVKREGDRGLEAIRIPLVQPDSIATTGDVAQINDAAQTGLSLEDADDLADLLNRIDRERLKRTS